MTDDTVVRQRARQAADLAREQDGLSDRAAEALRDILRSRDAYAHLVTAQHEATAILGTDAVPESTAAHIGDGVDAIAHALDDIVDEATRDARAVCALADDLDVSWADALGAYRGGYESVRSLQDVDLHVLVADCGMHPERAERLRTAADEEAGDE
jgi:hypothetical protein